MAMPSLRVVGSDAQIRAVWADVLSQAVTGELVVVLEPFAVSLYRAVARATDGALARVFRRVQDGAPPVRPVVDQRHGPLDLRTQRDVGRVLRPSRGDRGRRAARLLHGADGRGRSDAVGAHHLRADGERWPAVAREENAPRATREGRASWRPRRSMWCRPHGATSRGTTPSASRGSAQGRECFALIDEYRLVLHPVLAGHGPTLFQGLEPSRHLEFVSTKRLKSGALALHYRRKAG